MLTLGFTNHYYTLWSVTQGNRHDEYGRDWFTSNHQYQQNLSMDYDAAIAKIEAISGGKYEIDLNLKGTGSFITERMITDFTHDQFTFGKLISQTISGADDVWQLNRAMNQERGGRRRVNARRRLIELGELVRYDWVEEYFDQQLCDKWWIENGANYTEQPTHSMFVVSRKRKYATVKQKQYIELKKAEAQLNGHYWQEGARINMWIKRVGRFHFETAFGTTFVEKYITNENKMVKYMGSNPPEISETEFVYVTGTIKHDNYKGQKETKIQRIKVAKK